jgi:hypothetical protein
MDTDQTFTPGEAEALLPRIIPLLEEIQQLRSAYVAGEEQLEALQEKLQGNGHIAQPKVAQARAAMAHAVQGIDRAVAAMNALGVLVKDLESGLVDFPARRQGREVYLCWRLGEPRIGWWHPTDSGFADRLPIETF